MIIYDIHGQDLDISHICHNKCCMNIDHLALENHYTNCDRRECVHMFRCSKSHSPACLI